MTRAFLLQLFSVFLKILAVVWALFAIFFDLWLLFQSFEAKGILISAISLVGFTIFFFLLAVVEIVDSVLRIEESTQRILESIRTLKNMH